MWRGVACGVACCGPLNGFYLVNPLGPSGKFACCRGCRCSSPPLRKPEWGAFASCSLCASLLGGPRFENAMNAADTAWRRPPRPPRPRFLASSILPALTIFLTAILQISAPNSLHEHENRNSDLYCNKTLVSTSQCSLRTKIPLCHNGTHASSQLRALTPPEHFSTPLLETLPTTLHEKSFMRLPAYWPPHALAPPRRSTAARIIDCYY